MLTQSTRVFLPLSVLSLVSAVSYGAFTGDFAGVVLMLLLMAVTAFAAVAVTGARENESAPFVAADAAAPRLHPVEAVAVPGGGAWPLAAAVAAGLLVLSPVVGMVAFIAGLCVAAVAAVGWLARVTGDHLGRDVNLMPLGLPVVGLFSIASVMFFMSRILLAVPEQAATGFALTVAVVIMAVASLVALRPSISGRAMVAAVALFGVLMTGGGLAAAAVGERKIGHESHAEGGPATVKAKGIAFLEKEIHLKADAPAVIDFDNQDKGIPHNIAIYTAEDYAQAIFTGNIASGPIRTVYEFKAPPAGTYPFKCDVHANMTGKVVVA